MPKLNWDADDLKNPQDSSGTSTENISGGGLEQGYKHGSLTEGLVAYYPLDSGSGSTAVDEALGNDGTINPGSNGNASTDEMWTTNSKIGLSCLGFDGSDDYIEAPNSSSLDITGDNITMSAWVYLNAQPSNNKDMVLNKENEYELAVNTSGHITWAIRRNGNWSWIDTGVSISTGAWNLIMVTYDGEEVKTFKNGSLGHTYSLSGELDSTDKPFTVGWRGSKGESPWNGKLDDVRIYDRPLSTPEIKALYELDRPSKVSAQDTLQ